MWIRQLGGGGDGDADHGLAGCLSRHCDMSLPRIVTATSVRSHRTISSTTRSAWRSGGGPSDAMVGTDFIGSSPSAALRCSQRDNHVAQVLTLPAQRSQSVAPHYLKPGELDSGRPPLAHAWPQCRTEGGGYRLVRFDGDGDAGHSGG